MKKILSLFWLVLLVFLIKNPVKANSFVPINDQDNYGTHYSYISIGAMIALIKVDTPPKPNSKGKTPPPLPEKRADQKANKIKKASETSQYDKLPPPQNRTSSSSSSSTSGIYGVAPPEKKQSSQSGIYGAAPPPKAPKALPKIPVAKSSTTAKPLPKTPTKAAKPLPATPTKKVSPKVTRRKKSH
jgi:hypothetical protein